jgi:hypothetical protein
VINGSSSPATFTVSATYEDGYAAPVTASWTFDRLDLALVDTGDGTLTAHGTLGGEGTLTASYGDLEDSAAVTVRLVVEDDQVGLAQAEKDAFDTPGANPSGTLLYPYDATMFARDILAPELMWSGGVADDTYRIRLTEDHFEATIYTTADPPSAFLMSDDVWRQLSKSNAGDVVNVEVIRKSGTEVMAPMAQTWKIAQGSLRGTIYYWAVNQGQSMKIGPGDTSPSVVFDSGDYTDLGTPAPTAYDNTVPPWTQGVNNKRCVACHTVSKNGERLAGVFENKGSAPSPWGVVDLSASTPAVQAISPYTQQTLFLALTPDGSYLVHNDVDFTLHLADATTGAPIASLIDSFTSVADPAFSSDASKLAFSSNTVGSYPVEFSHADLDVVDFDPTTQTFSNRQTILDAGADAVAFPSFSPDGQWVFYQRGDYSRAKYGASSVGHCDLYMIDVAGAGGQIALDNANGVGMIPADQQNLNYQPNANPVAVGGYYWVVFFSPRDYGNKMVSSGNATYQNRKQLWVAAVDINAMPGQDPSHPAFYLRGQDLSTVNMKGYWALDPCKQEGNACDAGYECCTGFCQPDGMGGFACVPPGDCAEDGEACDTEADCCDPDALCVGGFCSPAPPN